MLQSVIGVRSYVADSARVRNSVAECYWCLKLRRRLTVLGVRSYVAAVLVVGSFMSQTVLGFISYAALC